MSLKLSVHFADTDLMTIETVERTAPTGQPTAAALERTGRRWLIWSFIFCPCHLPLSMALLASVFGGSAFGAMISRNALGTGLALGTLYAIGVAIGFRYLRKATKGIDCRGDTCSIAP